ncbi:hypothetical protein LSAT2_011596 [Lamellibrachia satsuma]|nr:hypothetical protein LSAT2_011596 [Lamellibrachia satsuma]
MWKTRVYETACFNKHNHIRCKETTTSVCPPTIPRQQRERIYVQETGVGTETDTLSPIRIIDHLIGCVGMTRSAYTKRNPDIIDLDKDHNYPKGYTDNLCPFPCLALHRGCDVPLLEPAVKKLYEACDDTDGVAMRDFTDITLEDLYRI